MTKFTSTYLSSTDVHSLVASYDAPLRKQVLSSYFLALSTLEERIPSEVPRPAPSALFEAASSGKASIYALFGGQGTNEVYLDELQSLYDIYKPFVSDLIAVASEQVLKPLATQADLDGHSYYSHGLDILAWLDGSSPRPSVEYVASIPISFPLIGLTQLVQYLVTVRVANLTPGEFRARIAGATGHSQGIVSAVAIAASDSLQDFTANSLKALRWLFYSGLRGQEAFPVLSVEPSIVADAVEGGEGTPSPMLNVSGLSLSSLEGHVKKANAHLPSNSQLFISLHNGPRTFVVTGPARALYGLVTALRAVKAPAGADQSKIPFSQRKAVFSTRFLVVGVPYHSDYLSEAAEKVCQIDLKGEELWKASDIKISVTHTESG